MKKYEFTGETKTITTDKGDVTLRRIRAVANFGNTKAGELGGWIEKEQNLLHDGNAWVCGNAWVYGDAKVYGNAWVYGDAQVYGNAEVWGNAKIYGDAIACDIASVCGNAEVCGNAWVYGDAKVYGNAKVCDDAEIFSPNHVLVIGVVGSRNAFTTFYRGKNKQIMVDCGCFNGTLDEFLNKVKKTHDNNHHAVVYRAAVVVARLQIDLSGEA